ncbi:hypothetical protein BJ741DRAFT_627717 [Chytriomyces cf. hyalinus JEL632]|nr:hypothetical protein BJ741DRAFT_627717 [Chytriomyces cf. hyalinus JEL632]
MHLLLSALTLACSAQVHALFTVANFTFSATQTNATTALVCITGAVPTDTYIGFGIPFVASEPYMARSDLTIVYANASKSIVQLHGRGMLSDGPFYADDAVMERPTTQVPVPGNSSYENGVLKACFSRPLNYTSSSSSGSEEQVLGNNLVVGNSTFMWSTGQVLDGMALSHIHDDAHRGSVAGVNLFPVVSTTATATASSKNSSTATATAKASSATSNKSSSSSTQTARALLNRLLMKRVARRY